MEKELSARFIDIIPKAMHEIRVELRAHRSMDLSVPQFRILAQLSRTEKTNKELAEYLGVSVAAMSRMVNGLISRGLIQKTCNTEDRREHRIKLTKAGRKSFDSIRQKARKGFASRFNELSTSEKKSLQFSLDLLQRMFRHDSF